MIVATNDLDRLRHEYARRRASSFDRETYSVFNKANIFILQQRQLALLSLLRQQKKSPQGNAILEIGCGRGGVLIEYLGYGTDASSLYGIDLLHDRLVDARRRIQDLTLACADGQSLPFAHHQFDIVLQYTAFSSILDSAIKRNMAQEMLRVVKPDGLIIWYDFWLNPTNPQTRGIRKPEIYSLFPGCDFEFKKITLAPPIARRLVPVSWILALLLEKLTILNTHYLVAIRPKTL